MIGPVTSVGAAAGAYSPPAAATSLEARVAAAAQPALEAWNARGLEGTVKLGPHEMPAASALGILSIEFLVHAWDFAQATGQQVTVPEGLAAFVLDVAGKIITPGIRSSGSFADAVPAGPHPRGVDRLIPFTGRHVPARRTAPPPASCAAS